ncbi:Uncharacterised protein [Serratia proteamaculans]|nr:Uncharacterised protein [Serratia proteamaculans]CAI1102754.1 Uncharacterised protein [Serratia proteamaculans]CAI1107877.1 Uncharacterised protein [Serratia proteamaculans]CAI1130880.1 Uncharacterised protein [Serratia proteamaculans]CAI2127402.1 Uncharacterised protein [Serratia proteamaculans]
MVRKWLILISWPTTRQRYYDTPVNRICRYRWKNAQENGFYDRLRACSCAPIKR